MKLKDTVALITGGSRGIGKEIAICFAKEGADIAICDINLEGIDSLKNCVEDTGRKFLALKSDVNDFTQVHDMVNNILDKFGKIDILVNNAGITRDGLLLRMKEAEWDSVLGINLKGTFNCTKAVSKIMIKQRKGKIINMASIIGLIGNVGQANYAASKAGIIGFTKSVARELASRNINVNAVAPGYISTEMTKSLAENIKEKMLGNIALNRFGEPKDIANLCVFLASEDSDYITGQAIVIDGGMTMH